MRDPAIAIADNKIGRHHVRDNAFEYQRRDTLVQVSRCRTPLSSTTCDVLQDCNGIRSRLHRKEKKRGGGSAHRIRWCNT
ncbi:hypothetical protein IF1G_02285 [Cordyceps javanica]|uniref:Uncharacterized protein n=1 Tax=Cordyceps javanica TaxID=43265 RepID=A0A545V916_9HYPO|nr:hypothetical protein IF1G_02285 [Cordyceps javanica]